MVGLFFFCLLVYLCSQNHEEFRGLERAKEAMVDVAQYINEVKRDSEVLVLLKNVQVRFKCVQNYNLCCFLYGREV